MLDSYSEITNILAELEVRTKRKNIFISGAAIDYTPFSEEQAYDFIHRLSYKLAEKEYKIVSGYGLGIGSMVINGALDFKIKSNFKSLDDLLVLRPFPQKKSSDVDFDKQRDEYREDMISSAGIAIFIFGNKQEKNNDIVNARGVFREFEIAVQHGLIPIPLPNTGYMSEYIFEQISQNPKEYYGSNEWIYKDLSELTAKDVSLKKTIEAVIKIINKLNK